MSNQFLSPVGRLVQGDAFEPQTKDQQGNPLVIKSGPNAGQPTQKWFIAVAFPKTDPAWPAFHAQIINVARAAFPQFFNAQGQCTHPAFSFKIADGDGIDQNGKPNSTKEGFAGHWVVRFSSSFPPKCFYSGRYQAHEQIQDKMAIRRGYYVRVAGTIDGNGNTQGKPGVYINLNMIELVAQGQEIVSGPDAASVFGAAPVAALPAGAMPLPGGVAPGGAPMAAAAMTPAAPVAAAPAPAFGTPAPLPPTVPAVPAAPQYRMTAKANGATRDQFIAQGWTDELLRQHGMME
jgi:hypothetical protein